MTLRGASWPPDPPRGHRHRRRHRRRRADRGRCDRDRRRAEGRRRHAGRDRSSMGLAASGPVPIRRECPRPDHGRRRRPRRQGARAPLPRRRPPPVAELFDDGCVRVAGAPGACTATADAKPQIATQYQRVAAAYEADAAKTSCPANAACYREQATYARCQAAQLGPGDGSCAAPTCQLVACPQTADGTPLGGAAASSRAIGGGAPAGVSAQAWAQDYHRVSFVIPGQGALYGFTKNPHRAKAAAVLKAIKLSSSRIKIPSILKSQKKLPRSLEPEISVR